MPLRVFDSGRASYQAQEFSKTYNGQQIEYAASDLGPTVQVGSAVYPDGYTPGDQNPDDISILSSPDG